MSGDDTHGDWLILGSAWLMWWASGRAWFSLDVGPAGTFSRSGREDWAGLVALGLGLGMAAHVVLWRWTRLRLPPLPWPQLHLWAGLVALGLVLWRWVYPPDAMTGFGLAMEMQRSYGGLGLALIASGGLAVGGMRKRWGRRRARRTIPTPF